MMGKMGKIIIKAPRQIDCDVKQWPAEYTIQGAGTARLIRIESRSAIDVVVAKISENALFGHTFYVSCPDFGVAIPGIETLQDTFWITEKLMRSGLPAPDAVTAAAVLHDLGDF